MPRSIYPRAEELIDESGLTTTPELAYLTATIGTWEHEAYDGDGSIAVRIVGVVPFDGVVTFVDFIPDVYITPDPDKRWVFDVEDVGEGGDLGVPLTAAASTGFALDAGVPLELDQPDGVDIAGVSYELSDIALQVIEDSVLIFRAIQVIEESAEDTTASARPTGMVRVCIARTGGS